MVFLQFHALTGTRLRALTGTFGCGGRNSRLVPLSSSQWKIESALKPSRMTRLSQVFCSAIGIPGSQIGIHLLPLTANVTARRTMQPLALTLKAVIRSRSAGLKRPRCRAGTRNWLLGLGSCDPGCSRKSRGTRSCARLHS